MQFFDYVHAVVLLLANVFHNQPSLKNGTRLWFRLHEDVGINKSKSYHLLRYQWQDTLNDVWILKESLVTSFTYVYYKFSNNGVRLQVFNYIWTVYPYQSVLHKLGNCIRNILSNQVLGLLEDSFSPPFLEEAQIEWYTIYIRSSLFISISLTYLVPT